METKNKNLYFCYKVNAQNVLCFHRVVVNGFQPFFLFVCFVLDSSFHCDCDASNPWLLILGRNSYQYSAMLKRVTISNYSTTCSIKNFVLVLFGYLFDSFLLTFFHLCNQNKRTVRCGVVKCIYRQLHLPQSLHLYSHGLLIRKFHDKKLSRLKKETLVKGALSRSF